MASAISAAKATVFLVEDHPILAQGLKALIDDESDLAVCGMAVDADASLAAIVAARPSVAIVDLTLRSGNGLDLIKALRERLPDLPTLVLSMHDESLYAERALRAGARGYVMKKEASERILAALRKVLAGEVYVSEKTASKMLSGIVEGRGAELRWSG